MSTAQPRILTFNFHEPYLCLMAKTGLAIDVGQYESGPLQRLWQESFRPKPANLTLIPEAEWRRRALEDHYDVIIAQNENNALDLFKSPSPKLLLCHNRRSFLNTTVRVDDGDPVAVFASLLENLRKFFEFLFISESKRDDYGIPGKVIPPGIDVEEYGGYTGEDAQVLRVGNTLRERNLMFDVDFQERACEGLTTAVVGFNPSIPGAAPASSFDALLACYRRARCYLHVTREAYEDGYNLALLEAMACGTPVVALANPTSPLTHGVDGYTSYDAGALREHLTELLGDLGLARQIGAKGRETIALAFPMEAFCTRWREAIEVAAERSPRSSSKAPKRRPGARRLLLHYMKSPLTTGRYLEEALRESCEVLGVGAHVNEALLRVWGFDPPPPPLRHEVDLPHGASCRDLLARLPKNYQPDLYLWVDSSAGTLPNDVYRIRCPRAAWFIDTHLMLDPRLEMARRFDHVFLAQKAQLPAFKAAGVEKAHWLPLACDPALHEGASGPRTLDIAYVGSLSPEEGKRRHALLDKVAAAFPNHHIGKARPEEMARIYGRAKIVVNSCVNRDVNMRVFEALASGALLITDEAEGLEDLFNDGEHLVIYRDEEALAGKIAYYLAHEEERTQIAATGQRLVLEKHTYRHRAQEILDLMGESTGHEGDATAAAPPKSKDYYGHVRREVLQHIPFGARKILDVGCGSGALGRTLRAERNVDFVAGVEFVEAVAMEATAHLDAVHAGSIETMELPYEEGYFDCIVCADVLEHLVDPGAVLKKLGRLLSDDGAIVVSIPNARYYEVLAMLSHGVWSYAEAGILDSTHLRFFTRASLCRLVAEAGLEAAQIMPLNMADEKMLPRDDAGTLRMGKITLNAVDDQEYEDLLIYQFAVIACKPGRDRLQRAREAMHASQNEQAYMLAVDAVGVDEFERRHLMAKALARMGRPGDAAQLFVEALALRDDPTAAGDYGIVLVSMNRSAEAKPLLEKALAADPSLDRVRGALGLVALAEEQYEEAYGHLEAALRATFEYDGLIAPFIAVARATGKLAEAEALVREFAEFYPGNPGVACEHATALAELGRSVEARKRLETALALDPAHERARLLLQALETEETP